MLGWCDTPHLRGGVYTRGNECEKRRRFTQSNTCVGTLFPAHTGNVEDGKKIFGDCEVTKKGGWGGR